MSNQLPGYSITRLPDLPFLLLLALLVTGAYSNSFSSGFPLDNKGLILQDARVHDATRANVDLILNHTYWWPIGESGLYRPFTTLSYLFNYAILGNADRPFGYHAVNLALHLANVLLAFALLRQMADTVPAFGAVAIWALHPLSTEAVTNIVGRADLLAALGVLSALLMYVQARESRRRFWWLVGIAAFTAVGLFSKESAIVVAGIVTLYEICYRSATASRSVGHQSAVGSRRSKRLTTEDRRLGTDIARGFSRAATGAAVALAIPLFAFWIQRSTVLAAAPAAEFPFVDNPIAGAGFWTGRATAVVVIARYLWLLVWPRTLSSDYSYSQIPLFTGTLVEWAALAIVAAAAAGGVWLWRRNRREFFWAGFAGLTLLPAANLLFASGTIMAERVMYLPSLGVIATVVTAVAQGLRPATERRTEVLRHFRRFGLVAICAAVAVLTVRTWVRNKDWHDDITLWTSAVEASPRSFKAHRGLAEALYDADPAHANIDRVVAEIERSVAGLEELPDSQNDARTYRQGGAYRMEQGDIIGLPPEARLVYTRAEALLTRSIRIIDAHASTVAAADAYRLLSAVDVRLQKNDAAIDAAARARTLDPLNAIGYRQAAAAYVRANRADDAAVALMTGSLVTSDRSLRDELVDLYKRGLDPLGCALVQTPNGPAIDPSCATVRRHACAAVREALQVHERSDRPDLAQRLKDGAARQFHCE